MNKILLIEDDESFGYVLSAYLQMHDYQVDWFKNGEEGLKFLDDHTVDLCVLDIMLPNMNGYDIAEEVKKMDSSLPFIFLSAKTLKVDKLRGFKIGADDYIVKPVDEELLLAKVKAIMLRISSNVASGNPIRNIGQYEFSPLTQTLEFDGERIKLTTKESALLEMLFQYKDSLLDRKKALKEIWGSTDEFSRKSMDVFISKLRKYLSKDARIRIENIHGKGFILHA